MSRPSTTKPHQHRSVHTTLHHFTSLYHHATSTPICSNYIHHVTSLPPHHINIDLFILHYITSRLSTTTRHQHQSVQTTYITSRPSTTTPHQHQSVQTTYIMSHLSTTTPHQHQSVQTTCVTSRLSTTTPHQHRSVHTT